MRILKFLQIPARNATLAALATLTAGTAITAITGLAALATVSGLSGCASGSATASPAAAEKYAVALANDRCEKEFGKRPFKTGRFPATQSGDRWLWGWLDGSGVGYTAQVSFRADRSEADAKVYPATGEAFDMEAPNAPDLDFRPDPDVVSQHPEAE
jgi:hypothetical protein